MPVNEITLEELLKKRVDVRALLGNTTYDIKNKVMEHRNGLDSKSRHQVYESVETAFAVLEAVRENQNRYLAERHSPEFSTIFASYVAAGVGLDQLSGIETKLGEAKVGEVRQNYFRDTKIDFAKVYPNPRNTMLAAYSEAVEVSTGNLKEITADFFEWFQEQAAAAKDDERFIPLYRAIKKNPVKIGDLVFDGFKDPAHKAQGYSKKLSWDDLAGYEDVKGMFKGYCRILQNLEHCLAYQPMGELLPKGILLAGPPGTGKTTLAKILCDQADIPFESFGAADFGSSYVNQTAINLQKIFDQSAYPIRKGIAPASLLFIDEIDTIARVRGNQDTEGAKVVTTMCVNMNGHKAVDGVLVVGASNRPDVIDPAILRAGRFDEIIEMGYPDESALIGIYKVHINRRNSYSSNAVFSDIDIGQLVSASKNYSGADVNYVIARALRNKVIASISSSPPRISTQDLIQEIKAYNSSPRKWTIDTTKDEC